MRKKLLAITPIEHIEGLVDKLKSHFELTIVPDPVWEDIDNLIPEFHAIYTNPNKSRLRLSRAFIDKATNLEVIVTASTGLVHIDISHAKIKGIPVISLTREYETINRISSTAEHALALTLALVRNLHWAINDVRARNWDYEKYIGRQLSSLTVGIVGFGRLGKMYAKYIKTLGADILVCDPEYDETSCPYPLVTLEQIFISSDVIALHIHASPENEGLVAKPLLDLAKPDMALVNTSRGEVINEADIVEFLAKNPGAKLGTDVLSNEQDGKWDSSIVEYFEKSQGQVIITPHIGGMSKEAQEIAYHRVADMLIDWSKTV